MPCDVNRFILIVMEIAEPVRRKTGRPLSFDREAARGMRLNIASGTAVRFEPGQQRTVELCDIAGDRKIFGFRGLVNGAVDTSVKGAL